MLVYLSFVVGFLALICNFLILFVYFKVKKLRKNPSWFFIIAITATDLVSGCWQTYAISQVYFSTLNCSRLTVSVSG